MSVIVGSRASTPVGTSSVFRAASSGILIGGQSSSKERPGSAVPDPIQAVLSAKFGAGSWPAAKATTSRTSVSLEPEMPTTPTSPKSPAEKIVVRTLNPIVPPRRWTFDINRDDEEIMSPTWNRPKERRGSCRLTFDNNTAGSCEEGKNAMTSPAGSFTDVSNRLCILVGQTHMRMNGFVSQIHDRLKKEPDFFKLDVNMERLVDVAFSLSVAVYRLSKWLHQLEPCKVKCPSKPQKTEGATHIELMAEVKFALTRMDMLASRLTPMLKKIVNDAKNERPTRNGEPTDPLLRNPESLAKIRGIVDVGEMGGMWCHLEGMLQKAESLAHNTHSKPTTILVSGTVILAAIKLQARSAKQVR